MLNLIHSDDGASGSGTSSTGSAEEVSKCANDDLTATSWCVDCEQLICDNCVEAHQRLKITKDHTIKSKDAAENKSDKETKKEIKCQTHPQVKVKSRTDALKFLIVLCFAGDLKRVL